MKEKIHKIITNYVNLNQERLLDQKVEEEDKKEVELQAAN
jgi:hypothetical protein